ncbi:VOC family protein [Micromonospora sp. NPDC092111]|uniref:VOC family protein n=1 Tax=Micromonospora sp. NPDC092111 TaxID=3364289 RepID=UPI00382CA5D9
MDPSPVDGEGGIDVMSSEHPPDAPHLTVVDASDAIAFYTRVFGAVPHRQECLPDGRVLAAELVVDGHRFTVSEWSDPLAPAVRLPVLTVESADPSAVLQRAVAAGARITSANGTPREVLLRDPAGRSWGITRPERPA